jgi:AcrR family transcriptional regulator
MTVRELADAAHVTPGQISHYEHGRDRISHERVTEFARILRIKSNDLYQPSGSRLRRNHVRWRLMNFMAAVIAEAAALMSSRREAAADNEATMVAAIAVAVGASAAAASDAGAGEKSSLTTSADDTAVLPGHYTINAAESQDPGGKVAYDPPMSAAGEQASAQSTSAENGFIVSNPFLFTETASGNKDHSAFEFKASMDHHAVTDPEINDITEEHPEHPAHPHSDNFKFADDDGSTHSAHATGKDISVQSTSADNHFTVSSPFTATATGDGDHTASGFKPSVDHEATVDPGINFASVPKGRLLQHPADNLSHIPAQPDHGADPTHPHVEVEQSPSFKSADDGSANPGTGLSDPPTLTAPSSDSSGAHGPAAPALAKPSDIPGAVMSAAPDQFVFADKADHGLATDHKSDMTEIDHPVPADIQQVLDTAHAANAVSPPDPGHANALPETANVQAPHHHGDFHFA